MLLRAWRSGASSIFIEFMLSQIDKILDEVSAQIIGDNQQLPEHIQSLLSIMEYDDHYNTKWFKMFNDYLRKYSDVSIFLPINVTHDVKSNAYDFVNHIAWSTGFTASQDNEEVAAMDNIGFITFNALKSVSLFNLTGGIFKTKDWLNYKPSIKVAFNYEYLLRATNKGQMVYVVPKEGYYHEIFREGSLSSEYLANMDDKENAAWFELAKSEYIYESDRHISIKNEKEETLK